MAEATDSILPEWMIDETREPEMVSVWADAAAYIATVKRAYRRDNWQDQSRHCEVWSEKATILGAIRPVAERWASRCGSAMVSGVPPWNSRSAVF